MEPAVDGRNDHAVARLAADRQALNRVAAVLCVSIASRGARMRDLRRGLVPRVASVLPQWLALTGETHHVRPVITLPGGLLLFASALRWRRPEARSLLALSII